MCECGLEGCKVSRDETACKYSDIGCPHWNVYGLASKLQSVQQNALQGVDPIFNWWKPILRNVIPQQSSQDLMWEVGRTSWLQKSTSLNWITRSDQETWAQWEEAFGCHHGRVHPQPLPQFRDGAKLSTTSMNIWLFQFQSGMAKWWSYYWFGNSATHALRRGQELDIAEVTVAEEPIFQHWRVVSLVIRCEGIQHQLNWVLTIEIAVCCEKHDMLNQVLAALSGEPRHDGYEGTLKD